MFLFCSLNLFLSLSFSHAWNYYNNYVYCLCIKNMRDEFEYPSIIRLFRFLKESDEKKKNFCLRSTNEEILHLRDVVKKIWIASIRTAKESNWKKKSVKGKEFNLMIPFFSLSLSHSFRCFAVFTFRSILNHTNFMYIVSEMWAP